MVQYRFKIFLWDQFIRPLKSILTLNNLQALALSLIILNFVIWRSITVFWIFLIIALFISLKELIRYWRSGEFMYNYRKEKYPEYKKIIKEIKNGKVDKKLEGGST